SAIPDSAQALAGWRYSFTRHHSFKPVLIMSKFSSFDFKNQRTLIRVDFNVPVKEGRITDDTRIRGALPTIRKVLDGGGSVVLMSHWGRPLKDIAKKPHLTLADFSLRPVVGHLSELLGVSVQFAEDCIGEDARRMAAEIGRAHV